MGGRSSKKNLDTGWNCSGKEWKSRKMDILCIIKMENSTIAYNCHIMDTAGPKAPISDIWRLTDSNIQMLAWYRASALSCMSQNMGWPRAHAVRRSEWRAHKYQRQEPRTSKKKLSFDMFQLRMLEPSRQPASWNFRMRNNAGKVHTWPGLSGKSAHDMALFGPLLLTLAGLYHNSKASPHSKQTMQNRLVRLWPATAYRGLRAVCAPLWNNAVLFLMRSM